MNLKTPAYIELDEVLEPNNDFKISIIDIFKDYGYVIKRLYFLKSGKIGMIRGNHAHLNQNQILFLVDGDAEVNVINRTNVKQVFILDKKKAVIIPENHWIEVMMKPNTKILCLASKSFDEVETVKERDFFFKHI